MAFEASNHWEPPQPSIARVYDYALGGKDNFTSDRAMFERIMESYPAYRSDALSNRRFLQRSVTMLAERGIRQFLDLGSGIPTRPNVHEVARAVRPDARVVYSDTDDTAVTHGRAWLAQFDGIEYVQHDIEDIDGLLRQPEVTRTLDLDEPVAVLAYAVLHFVSDETVRRILGRVREVSAPGSMVALSVFEMAPEDQARLREDGVDVTQELGWSLVLRTPADVQALVADLDLEPPGLVEAGRWPEPTTGSLPPLAWLAGVAGLHPA